MTDVDPGAGSNAPADDSARPQATASPSTPEAWKKHIAEPAALEQAADRNMVAARLERGRRIAKFHAAEKEAKWFKSWAVACREVVGLDPSTGSMYEIAGLNLIDVVNDFLPPDVVNLYHLGNARAASKEFFAKAIKDGDIHPQMTRADAKDICEQARDEDPSRQRRRRSRQRGNMSNDKPRPEKSIVAQLLEAADDVPKELRKWAEKEIDAGFPYPDENDPKLAPAARVEYLELTLAKVFNGNPDLLREQVEAVCASWQQSEAHDGSASNSELEAMAAE
jgi:hypothetical protein